MKMLQQTNPYKLATNVVVAAIAGILFVWVCLILGQTASANVVLSPDPGSIPAGIRSYVERSDSRANSPSLNGWVARQGFPAQQSILVPRGATTINLTYHSIGTVGFKPSSTTRTRYYVESATAGVAGVVGQYNELVFAPRQNVVGATATAANNFSFAPAGGFPVSGTYTVTLNTRIINEFNNGAFFRCVADGATASSLSDYSACPLTPQPFEIIVTVPPPPIPGCTDSTAINYDSNATVDDGSCIYDVCNNLPGNQATIPAGHSSNGSGGCIYPAPSCGGNQNISIAAGLSFTARKSFKNDNTVAMPVSAVKYKIDSVVPVTNASPVSVTIGAGAAQEFTAQAHTINLPGSYTITWTLSYAFGTKECSDTITVTVVAPSCSASTFSLGTRDLFTPKVTVQNDNYVPLDLTAANYTTEPPVISGSALSLSPVAGRASATYDAAETSINVAGEYKLKWTVSWSIGTANGTVPCESDKNLVSNQPYVRLYGNDVVSGGGFGENCTTSGDFDVLGYGKGNSHASYLGSASELAVFAVGQIQNVLPGSQRNRPAVEELAFGNIDSGPVQVDSGSGKFGGGFGSVMCAQDYFAKASTADKKLDTTVDLSSLESGSYSFGDGLGSTIIFTTGSGIPDGRKLLIYVDGHAQISNAGTNRFGYANAAGNWASVSDIPSLYIVSSGNIYVQNDISTMDGVYIAQPRFANDDTTGKIYTCAKGAADPLTGLDDKTAGANADFILNDCDSRLTVNGAFIAKRVHLLRSYGTVNDGKPFESYEDPTNHIAEVFRFTPELYFVEGGGLPPRSTNAKIDSILALPPSF